jgi:hypothetical protein
MTKLYEIAAELEAAMAEIDDDGEIPEDLAQTLDQLQLDLDAKVENCCRVV